MKSARPLSPRIRSWVTGARAAGAMAMALAVASCSFVSGSSQTGDAPVQPDPAIAAAAPAELRDFYAQQVDWSPCESKFSCAKIKVPLDYANPDGASIEIAALKLSATGRKTGSLLVNPGGPGASGYDFAKEGSERISAGVRAKYDVVGFDPRGVQRSAPVQCLTDQEREESRAKTYELDTDAGLQAALADNKVITAKCVEKTGPVLGHIDTASAAKDLDILRAVLNDTKLNYLGYSYGTFLGSTYAELFPENVGRMVLDGAMDPSLGYEEITRAQAKAFEKAVSAYAQSCLRESDCPLSGSTEDAVQQIRDLIAAVEENPLPGSGNRQVSASTFVSGLIFPLYNDLNWPALTKALAFAAAGDGSEILRLADYSADRNPDGSYNSNMPFAFHAVNCLDHPMVSDTAAMRAEDLRLRQISPTFGYYFAYSGSNCKDWPHENVRTPAPVEYTGSAQVLVIGTTGDPATPHEWAGALRKQLGNAALLTWEGEGHTAYGRGNACVARAVDGYLLEGKAPADNTVC